MNNLMGERIKECRKRINMTQTDLGARYELEPSAVSKWEKGRTKNIKHEIVMDMANLFEVSPMWLMGVADRVGDPPMKNPYDRVKEVVQTIAERYSSLDDVPDEVLNLMDQLNKAALEQVITQEFLLKARGEGLLAKLEANKADKEDKDNS